MLLPIADAAGQTVLFGALLVIALILTARWRTDKGLARRPGTAEGIFPIEATNELKGLAIVMIALAHIGFFLAADTRFLSPLSDFAGIGVDLFLFLSGYGLTASALKKTLAPAAFYAKRLLKLFIPLWIILIILFVHQGYDPLYIVRSFLGWYPHADLYQDIDSPLWYFSAILLYYLAFPIIFSRRYPWLSAILIAFLGYTLVYHLPLPVTIGVLTLYKLHFIAFPLGMVGAWIVSMTNENKLAKIPLLARAMLSVIFLAIAWHAGLHGGFGQALRIQQLISLVGVLALVGASILKPIEFRALAWWGIYSYEIYLIHWPLMYHYDFVYRLLPPAVATFVYLFVFIGAGYILQACVAQIAKLPNSLRPRPKAS